MKKITKEIFESMISHLENCIHCTDINSNIEELEDNLKEIDKWTQQTKDLKYDYNILKQEK